jgi:prophage tail gpP-like protein
MMDPDDPILTINSKPYRAWTGLSVDRRLENLATHLDLSIAEAWDGEAAPWQIAKFDLFTMSFGNDLVMTGVVDDYLPTFDENTHGARVTGRSKTGQLIDCSPDIPGGQYRGFALGPIARGISQPFGISVVDVAQSTLPLADATLQRTEKAYAFLQRLGRLSSVLLTDDPQGRLVLTQTGTTRATDSLVQGINVKRATGRISGQKQFSQYVVLGQHAIGSAAPISGLGDSGTAPAPTPVATQMRAVATDTSVPLYRPRVTMAEGQLSQAGMQARANWERNYAYGRSTQADLTVVGWRQSDGTLWTNNQITAVVCPYLEIDQDLLIVGTKFTIDPIKGKVTVITVAPPEGYTPEPGQVKSRTKKGKKGSLFQSSLGDPGS